MKIISVLVLYNCLLENSKTVNSIISNYYNDKFAFNNFKLILYDNGLLCQKDKIKIPFDIQYIHDPSNQGLAVAYNCALNIAVQNSFDWLLLLDQDSILTNDFIAKLEFDLNNIITDLSITAVVPRMCYKESFFSPSKVLYGGTLRPINRNHKGICSFKVFAIGSGSAIRVSFLQEINGFNEFFWMDCLDRWLFYTIEKMQGKVFVSESIIEHELSVMDYDKFLNEKRYINIIKYETYFMRSYKTKMENYVYYLRLLKRTFYLFITVKNKNYSYLTFQHLLSITFHPYNSLKL